MIASNTMKTAHRIVLACVAGLIVLGLAWELVLAPLRPGGSMLALKVVPLLVSLPALARGGVRVGNFGDCEVFSFHATKFFNSFEGGGVATNDDALADDIRRRANFGFIGYDNVVSVGTNGKMVEPCAAMGLVNLAALPRFIAAIVVFQLIPGPGTLAILNATARNGVGAGLGAVLGTLTGDFLFMVAAVAGLAAVMNANPAVFQALQASLMQP